MQTDSLEYSLIRLVIHERILYIRSVYACDKKIPEASK